MSDYANKLNRPPDLKVGPFAPWIHSYEHADADEYYDANWLRVTAHCGAAGASVECSGSILMTSDLHGWCSDLERMHVTLSGAAHLQPLEQELAVRLTATTHGHIDGVVDITPDPGKQTHQFRFELDQSHLPAIIAQLRAIQQSWQLRLKP